MTISRQATLPASDGARTQIRTQMRVCEKYAYFDHAAVAPLPTVAATAIAKYASEAAGHGDALWLDWAAKVEELRTAAATMFGAKTAEIALLNNTTQGINLVALGFPWRSGDNLVVPENEFPSNLLPWKSLEPLGVEVRMAKVPPSGELTPDCLAPYIDSRTRLISLSWVGFSSGYRVDPATMAELAHSNNALLFLDAIQGVGAFPIDVAQCGADFVCADGHKWMLGPEGAGLFFVKKEHLGLLRPVCVGWNSLEHGGFDPTSTKLKTTAARYEGGTMNMAGMHGLLESVSLLLDSGLNAGSVARAILANVEFLTGQLAEQDFTTHVASASTHRSGIVGVTWAESAQNMGLLTAARKHLLKQNIVTSVRGGRLRISTHAYNNESDIERLVEALTDFRDFKKAARE